MKKSLLLILIALTLNSCTKSKVKDAIINYNQTLGTTKIDLKMRVISLEQIGTLSYGDSLKLIKEFLNIAFENTGLSDKPIDSLLMVGKTNIIEWRGFISELDSQVKALEQTNNTEDFVYGFKKGKIIEYTEKVKVFEDAYNQVDSLNTLMVKYKSDTAKLIANKWKCNYSIENPLLNNLKQELTQTFLVTPDNKVLGTIP